jgi:outer membrane receptor protein involved in Fe transport
VPRTTDAIFLGAFAALPVVACAQAQEQEQEQEQAIPTVTVAARKDAVVRQIDKTVHDVSNAVRAANGSAQDVLQSTPGVTVTADGQISVKGTTQVTVLVDGKPAAMLSGSGEERAVALQTMSGADIASVEVITNPSAAYQANGGAIVNIVLKRNRKPGAHAQLRGSASDQGLWNAAASGDLTRNGVGVHGNLALRHDGNLKIRESTVDWHNPVSGQSGRERQASTVFVHRVVDSAAFGIDDNLSELDTVSLSARYDARRSNPLFDVLDEQRSASADKVFHRISRGPNRQSDAGVTLAWSRQDRDVAIKAAARHSATTTLVDKSYRDVFVLPQRPADVGHGATRTARHLNQLTLDWTRAVHHGQWGAGLDVQDKTDGIANYQALVDPSTDTEAPDPDTTNAYAVTTALAATYLTRRIRQGNWEMLLGGRAERMAVRVNAAGGAAHRGTWRAFDPSLHLQYAAAGDTDLTLSYRRSLQMPDPRDLNPRSTYIDAQNLSRGNPGLSPQRLTAWEAEANGNGAHRSGGVGVFYRTSRGTVFDARSFAGNVLVTSKQNGGRARSAGVTGSFTWKPDARLNLDIDGGVYRVLLETPDLEMLMRQGGTAGYLNLRAAHTVGADDVALDAHGQSASVAPLGRQGATGSVNLSWKHALNNLLSLTVNANDLFDGSRRTDSTSTGTFRQSGFNHFVARRLYVGFVRKIE